MCVVRFLPWGACLSLCSGTEVLSFHCDKWARESQEMRREKHSGGGSQQTAWMKRDKNVHEWSRGERWGGAVGRKWWMSRAWPQFQVNLRGVFDPTRDLKDHMVIEGQKMVLNTDGDKMGIKWLTRWLRQEGDDEERVRWGYGMKDRVKKEVTA